MATSPAKRPIPAPPKMSHVPVEAPKGYKAPSKPGQPVEAPVRTGAAAMAAAAAIYRDDRAVQRDGQPEFKTMQIQFFGPDYNRVKAAFALQGMGIQEALIRAVNILMSELGAAPVSNPGSKR